MLCALLSEPQVIFKALGAIPGPIVYGAVLDGACLFKQSSCHAADASCVVMDNRKASQASPLHPHSDPARLTVFPRRTLLFWIVG